MKNEDLLRALNDVDPKLLQETERMRSRGRSSAGRSAVLLLVAASILLAGIAAIYFSVRIRRNSVGASVASDVPTSMLEPKETESGLTESPETEEEPREPKKLKEYDGISEIEVIIARISDDMISCRCSIVCDPGCTARASLSMTGAGDSKEMITKSGFLAESKTWSIPSADSCQAGLRVTVYNSEGEIINQFSKYSEPIVLIIPGE